MKSLGKTLDTILVGAKIETERFFNSLSFTTEKKIYDQLQKKFEKELITETDLIYNTHYFKQHISNGYHPRQLIIDSFDQVEYLRNPHKKYEADMICNYLNYNISSPLKGTNNLIKTLITNTLQGQKSIVINNHSTFANIPILIKHIGYIARQLGYKENDVDKLRDSTYTVLGGALMTQVQRNIIHGISNILKTHPKTDKGIIENLETEQDGGRKKFLKKLISLLGEEGGKIILIAPTATRDTIIRTPENTNTIYFGNDTTESVSATNKLLKTLSNGRVDTFIMAGFNDTELKNPVYVNPTNHDWKRNADIVLNAKEFSPKEFQDLIEQEKVMHMLANLVTEKYGHQVAHTLDSQTLEQKKQEAKQPNNYYRK